MDILKSVQVTYVMILLLAWHGRSVAQFSPGELSKAHQQLEGMNNCLECHETGKEIGGRKCLTCHQEIKAALDDKRGYHFLVAAQPCVACHKEHLGRDAKTIRFDRQTFDHALTGFIRTGKHLSIRCEDCHTKKNITDARVLKIVGPTGRETFLGLSQTCVSCHPDRHNKTVGTQCQSCHGTKAWSPVTSFDHAKTKFPLAGKHATVMCRACHTDLDRKDQGSPLLFSTKNFVDCAPCHASPHSEKFAAQTCSSCHSPEGWNNARKSGTFNHDLTAFRLAGKHATVACEKCHRQGAKSVPGKSMRLAHSTCTDCHKDEHGGEFAQRYRNNCDQCHTVYGFRPATFTVTSHGNSRFPLTGAHAAIPCGKCHNAGSDGRPHFRFVSIRCEACHRDEHGGQFAKEMKEQSCAACHTTEDWTPKNFDHAKTGFVLAGKHLHAKCENCHKPRQIGNTEVAQYKGTSPVCETCHREPHAGQFAANGTTNCAVCHQPQGWKTLVFDHNVQSTFALTGAHKRVECRECHREERRGGSTLVRYKPLSTTCESCHAQGSIGNG